ncbi:hypothetical protein H2200_003048 [Cladophialophora chaetospira]|uniref:BTB domain-containing protein n=1 Tax=Cladophialophora chaetospira TaxID=386627 RepID=A0AA38XGR9_9EURO|nr:hypothetical protein H2200_003048 [Cladophialophora chaetospira]
MIPIPDPDDHGPPRVARGTKTITVHVGSEPAAKQYILHKALICAASRFFHAALNGCFAEAQSGVVHLPEEDPVLFMALVCWLYNLDTASFMERYWTVGQDMGYYHFRVYCLADRLMVAGKFFFLDTPFQFLVQRIAPLIVAGLQLSSWMRIREVFNPICALKPTPSFLCALFDEEAPPFVKPIRFYVAEHMMHWMSGPSQDIALWCYPDSWPVASEDADTIREADEIFARIARNVGACEKLGRRLFSHPYNRDVSGENMLPSWWEARMFDQSDSYETERNSLEEVISTTLTSEMDMIKLRQAGKS